MNGSIFRDEIEITNGPIILRPSIVGLYASVLFEEVAKADYDS
jgi:hypothetical protein